MSFYRSHQFALLKSETDILTEEATAIEKENKVMKATSSGAVTLFTKCFGRGTDFKVFDPKIIGAGGVHVIQTFFSDDISDEVQIKGRTARQGHKGTYKLVVLDKTLEKYQISQKDGKWKSMWSWITKNGSINETKTLSYGLIHMNRDKLSADTY